MISSRNIILYESNTTVDIYATDLLKLISKPAPILWDYYGSYFLVPAQHVHDIMEAQRRIQANKKRAWEILAITLNDAMPLEYEIGCILAHRCGNKKLDTRSRDRDDHDK